MSQEFAMEMPAAFVTAVNAVDFEFASARPDAPVVPYVEKPPRTRAVRAAVARRLARVAKVVRLA
ncbi:MULTISPECIES: hypothetical protein [unclassified Micromonospora]|uniref:hypothetical protein n=1 Tax=unclassified Micromonospora TaxID=2617518 RepID=UPI0022BEEFA5|nr:hypothetical protein [Micromonospora sp. AKA38]GHJ18113.1 hypothetical protein TPA0908_61080 [Micromonospora sp. AKA38]